MTTQQPEALQLADDRPTSLNDDLYQWAIDAEDKLRRLHEVNQELLAALKDMGARYGLTIAARAAIDKAERTTP